MKQKRSRVRFECTDETFRPADSHDVRWWREQDWQEMYQTYEQVFQVEPWHEKDWKDLYATGYEYCCIIKRNKAAACGGLWRRWKHTWEVIAVGTFEPHRGQGYAKAIISAATARILATVPRATITTGETNKALQRAAQAVGFQKIK